MVDTKDQRNAIVYCVCYVVVDTVNTGVCVMRCENSTLLCIQWPQIC